MIRVVPVVLLLPMLLASTACTHAGGGPWPSLAMRPGESAPLVPRPAAAVPNGPAGARAAAPRDPPAAPQTVAVNDAGARLASIERDTKAFAARLNAQLAATARAATAASGAPAGSEAGAAGQLELSRLDRLGGQGTDLRERLDVLAGDLARRGDAGGTLGAVGAEIERVEGLRAEQAKGFAEARARLPR